MKKWNKYIAGGLVVLFVFLELSRDVHYVLHHQPQGYVPMELGCKEAERHHYCCRHEPGNRRNAESQVSKTRGSCPFEHVTFVPFRSPEAFFLQGKRVLLKRFLNLFERCGVIRRFLLSHRLRAPPWGSLDSIDFNDAYLKLISKEKIVNQVFDSY